MRKMLIIIRICVLSLIALQPAFAGGHITGSGNIKSEKRSISGAKYLVNQTPAKVILTTGSNEQIVVETDDNLINFVNTYVRDHQLFITMSDCSFSTKYMVVYATLKDINGIKVKGSGDVVTRGYFKTNALKLLVQGSGNIDVSNASANKVTIAVVGSGDIKIGGETNTLEVEIKGSGDVSTESLRVNSANIFIAGSGDCTLYSANTLNVKILGSGTVYLHRKPSNLKYSITGSGSIERY